MVHSALLQNWALFFGKRDQSVWDTEGAQSLERLMFLQWKFASKLFRHYTPLPYLPFLLSSPSLSSQPREVWGRVGLSWRH